MLEGRLKAIVANLLGEWIESDKLDLSINIWNDENVRFENVNLKESIIPLSAPFRLKAGLIGALSMNIPFKTFGTTPAKITLSDVLVILSPRNLDAEEMDREVQSRKEEKIAALEKDFLERIHGPQIDKDDVSVKPPESKEKESDKEKAKEKKPKPTKANQGYYGADGFFGRLITRLMDNLHIEFKNVHVRFEGTDTKRDLSQGPRSSSGKFAVGFSIGALYAETTGSDWIPKPYNEADPASGNHVVFKLIQAMNLSAYVDPHALHFVHSSKHPRVLHATLSRLKAMSDITADLRWWKYLEQEVHTHRFVLAPFHVTLKLTMNISKAEKTNDTPHYSAVFEFSKLIGMLDDEQIVLINRILESFSLHDQWRNAITQRIRADEREHYTATLNQEYLKHWEAVHTIYSKQPKWELVKKSDAWKQLVTLEQLVSIEASISMRNSAAFECDEYTMDPDVSRTSLHDLGEAFGIPAPQINIKFKKGDLGLKMYLNDANEAIVDECYAQAKTKSAVKPGLILSKVDGQSLSKIFRFNSIEELYSQLHARLQESSCVLTFRHPGARLSQVTPNQLVSLVTMCLPNIEFRLVHTPLKQIITSAILQSVNISIRGFGPGLFSFHRYHLSAMHLYIQESVSAPSQQSCLAASVDRMRPSSDDIPVLIVNVNFLETNHPSVNLADLSTYASQYGIHIGDLILVYERTKVATFQKVLGEYLARAFPPVTQPPQSASSTTSALAISEMPTRVRYDFSIHSLRFFVKSVAHRLRATRTDSVVGGIQASNRSIFSQLTLHKAHASSALQEWLRDAFVLERVVAAVVHLQRFIRGRNIRRWALPPPKVFIPPAFPQDATQTSSGLHGDIEGYLYLHDHRLGCRKWSPFYFVLEKNGVLRVFRQANCHNDDYVTSFLMEDCVDTSVRSKDEEIIAPHFPSAMHFLEVKFRLIYGLPCNQDGVNPLERMDTKSILLASSQREVINSWFTSLSSYRLRKFDTSSRIPRPTMLGFRSLMVKTSDRHRGWLFRQDLSLSFRRWHEHFVFLDEFGQLRFYEDNTGRVLIDQEDVENITSVSHVGNILELKHWEIPASGPLAKVPRSGDPSHLGPGGDQSHQMSYCIEITIDKMDEVTRTRVPQTFLLASYSFEEIADWRYILWEKRRMCKQDPTLKYLRQKSHCLPIGWQTWWRSHIATRFSNTAKPHQNLKQTNALQHTWISLYVSQVSGVLQIHEPPPSSELSLQEGGAFAFDIRIGKLELRDRRSNKAYCVVYIGDTFLEFERGKLKAVAITSDQLPNKGQFTLHAKFRGPQMKTAFHGVPKTGLKIGVDFCGCILPHSFQTVLTDILKELSPMWEDKSNNSAPPSTEPYIRCQQITLEIRVGLFEAYVEEKHCVAKFIMENNQVNFGASTERESLDISLGSTSLHVMTAENQLRLAQIDCIRAKYELRMQTLDRTTILSIGQVKLEADGRMKILYQLFEALQLFDDEEDYDNQDDDDFLSAIAPSPMASPTNFLPPPSESSRPRHVRNESGVSMRSQRSARMRRSQTGRASEIHETLSYIQPLLSYQGFVLLLSRYNHSHWACTKDIIKLDCEHVVFEVVKRSLSLVALDTYIPVMKFSVSEISCSSKTSTEFRADFCVQAKVVFLARYYNTALADWEPVIEPWEVALNVDKPMGGESSSGVKKPLTIDLRARNRLNINFTEALVRLIVSVSKHHRSNVLKNSERAVPSTETSERVNVINNLGVPIRLANLNTSNPGTLKVEIRDGWNLPNYTRFHDIKVDVMLLPWWSPRESSGILESLCHEFNLEYGGANAGVAPKLRLTVSSRVLDDEHAVQLQLEGKQLSTEQGDFNRSTMNTPRGSTTQPSEKWMSIGSVELNLAGNLMGMEDNETKRIKFCQWHRLRDHRGAVTGEVLVALHFTPQKGINRSSTVQTVASGGSLMVDPFRLGSTGVSMVDSTDGDSMLAVKLPESVRNGYVPPLALEVMVSDTPRSLLCPLQRAGKFFIKGEGVLAEVKVAQRDEFRRVLMLSSPKQVKNLTSLTMNIGTFPVSECEQWLTEESPLPVGKRGRSISFPAHLKRESMVAVNPGRKYSLPLGALYSDAEHAVVLQVMNSKRTQIAQLATLHEQIGCHILYLAPLSREDCGYCFFMEILSHVRNVYREEQFDTESSAADIISHDAKYQIRLHAGFVFENALPIRLQYKLEIPTRSGQPNKLVTEGTLAPGEEVEIYYFHKHANMYLRAPEEATTWSGPISLAKCISQEATTISNQTISKADQPDQRRETELLQFYFESPVSNDLVTSSSSFTARLDYTVADNGSPRTVIYSTLWVYNFSHINDLMVRSAENPAMTIVCNSIKQDQCKPRVMDCPQLALEFNTVVNNEHGRWSERVHASVVGVQKSVALRGYQRQKQEVGVAIHRPLGQFHRTTQVIISPRYILINYTGMKFLMANEANSRGRVVEIPADAIETPFDYPFEMNFAGKCICLKAGGGADRNYLQSEKWSGMFSIENEDEFPLWLPGAQIAEPEQVIPQTAQTAQTTERVASLPRIRVKVHTVGAAVLIKLSKDNPFMLSVLNQTDHPVKLNQVNETESLIVPPGFSSPFAWECPDSPRKVSCSILVDRTVAGRRVSPTRARVCDFDSLDSEEAVVWGDPSETDEAYAAEVKFNASSRVLVFRKARAKDVTKSKYKLDVKVIAVRREDQSKKEAFVSIHTDANDSKRQITTSATIRDHGVYRFQQDLGFPCVSRPRHLIVQLFEKDAPEAHHIYVDDQASLPVTPDHLSPRSSSFQRIPDDLEASDSLPMGVTDAEVLWKSPDSSVCTDFRRVPSSQYNLTSNLNIGGQASTDNKQLVGSVEIKLPKKMWKQLRTTERKIGDLDGSWWYLMHDGEKIGKVQLAIKCTMIHQERDEAPSHFAEGTIVSMHFSSIGISFVHNKNRLDVAYFSMQRLNVLYEGHKGTSEIAVSVGNIQMDNQMDRKVVLGSRGFKRKEGVSVRLRDRWRQCLSHKHRKLYEQFDITMLPVLQFRMLFNDTCSAGSFHVELVELILQELEVTTDEKFVVNLISVFQGLESLSSSETFESVVDKRLKFSDIEAKPITDGLYIEQLDIESIRILFSLELNGGKHIATLGPSGRRLATYLPVSNVKDLRLYFSKLLFSHIYDSQTVILDKLYRHYLQQALLVVLQGLYTVTLFVNPFRIVYRLGHGVLEVVRLPARGLASGSPVELLSGAYLGVRSLAMNTISASYEAVAGATGAVSSIVAPFIFNPEKKQKFQEEMVNFQRAVMGEVDAFDAAEEQHMTRAIVRVPRTFTAIGLLVEYGPGSLPKDEQNRVDLKAAIVIQNWWRRRRLVHALMKEADSLKVTEAPQQTKSLWDCSVM